jgi:hypothetical protein
MLARSAKVAKVAGDRRLPKRTDPDGLLRWPERFPLPTRCHIRKSASNFDGIGRRTSGSMGREVKLSSPFTTVRYPDGAWELTPKDKVLKVGDKLWRSGGTWIVSRVAEDASGHVIVNWRRSAVPGLIGLLLGRARRGHPASRAVPRAR